jgi:hypothetical protein
LEGGQQLGLAEYLAGVGRFAGFAGMRQKNFTGVGPGAYALFFALNAIGGLSLYGIALG